MKIFFDVGSYDGETFINLCEIGDVEVHAFEPQPLMAEKIKDKTERLENFYLTEAAVSNYSGTALLNLSGGGKGGCSSLLTGIKKSFDESITVDVITLEDYIIKNDIPYIDFLHIDAQGSDLKVLSGLGSKKHIVRQGIMELSMIYKGAHTEYEMRDWFREQEWDYCSPEVWEINRRVTLFNSGRSRTLDCCFARHGEENWFFKNPLA